MGAASPPSQTLPLLTWRASRSWTISGCSQPTITDKALSHLKGIFALDISYCPQFTDAAFPHLKGIHILKMDGCSQSTITDAAFAHLEGIQALSMSGCNQTTLTDAAFSHLKGIQSIKMHKCTQPTITSTAFTYIKGADFEMSGASLPLALEAGLVTQELVDSFNNEE